jgi:hypothetical protein
MYWFLHESLRAGLEQWNNAGRFLAIHTQSNMDFELVFCPRTGRYVEFGGGG